MVAQLCNLPDVRYLVAVKICVVLWNFAFCHIHYHFLRDTLWVAFCFNVFS